jgi:hypothetical protein
MAATALCVLLMTQQLANRCALHCSTAAQRCSPLFDSRLAIYVREIQQAVNAAALQAAAVAALRYHRCTDTATILLVCAGGHQEGDRHIQRPGRC